MANTKVIKDIIKEMNNKASFINDFDKALVGYGRQYGDNYLAIYDTTLCIEILIEKNNMGIEEAYEVFNKSLHNGWPDKFDPIFINDFRLTTDPDLKIINEIKNNDETLKEYIKKVNNRKKND